MNHNPHIKDDWKKVVDFFFDLKPYTLNLIPDNGII
jgi:hypothetical protein